MKRQVEYVKNTHKNIIYVGNLPKQLTENQIKRYFSQFGKVLKVRLMRSKKTNGSKGYAFIKFTCNEIAQIAAEAMNNYFIDGKALRVHVKDDDEIVKHLFKTGKPVLNRINRIKALSEAIDLNNEVLEDKIIRVVDDLKNGVKSVSTEDYKSMIVMIEKKVKKLEYKKNKFSTDVYDDKIKDYHMLLDKLKGALAYPPETSVEEA